MVTASTHGRRSLLIVLALALVLRVGVFAHLALSAPGALRPDVARIEAELADPSEPFVQPWGFEAANVAWALVCDGQGLASPFGGRTGPTGWVSPGLVAPWAVAFSAFGCFSAGSVLAVLGLALVASLSMVAVGVGAAWRLHGSRRAGLVAGVFLACSPWDLALFHARSLFDPDLTPLAALGLLTLLLVLLEGGDVAGGRVGPVVVGFAVLAGAASLVNPVLVLPAAVGLGLVAMLRRRRVAPVWALSVFVAAQLVLVGPFVVSQRRALGVWSYVKSNGLFEVYLGNLPGVDGVYEPGSFEEHHPSANVGEFREFRRLGEAGYVWSRFDRFVQGFEAGRFFRASLRRLGHVLLLHRARPWQGVWSVRVHRVLAAVPGVVLVGFPVVVGLGWVRRRGLWAGDWVVFVLVGCYVLPFVVIGVTERYVLPLVPPVLVLAAGLVEGWLPSRWSAGGRDAKVVGAAACPRPPSGSGLELERVSTGGVWPGPGGGDLPGSRP